VQLSTAGLNAVNTTLSVDSAVGATQTPVEVAGADSVDGVSAGAVKQKFLVHRLAAVEISLHLTTFPVKHQSPTQQQTRTDQCI